MPKEINLTNLTEDVPPRRNGADLDDYKRMLQVSYDQEKSFGVDVSPREHSTVVQSRFRSAATEMGIGVRLQEIDTDDENTVRIRFLAKDKRERKASAVTTRKMTATQKRAASKPGGVAKAPAKAPATKKVAAARRSR